MRIRLIAALAATATFAVLTTASPASAMQVTQRQREAWVFWAFGSSRAPLLDPTLCGEKVGTTFFLTVAGPAPGTRTLDCTISAGTPLLAVPGGAIVWSPTDGTTDSELFSNLLTNYLAPLLLDSVKVKVDGVLLPRGSLVIPDPYEMELEPGNLIQTVDPAVTGDSTTVLPAFFFTRIPGLTPGHHRIVTADRFEGIGLFKTVFNFTVTGY
jgi:hypothetical protein